jgi:hypothetical protein
MSLVVQLVWDWSGCGPALLFWQGEPGTVLRERVPLTENQYHALVRAGIKESK